MVDVTGDVEIFMSRGPCLGQCPVYSVTICGDGRVQYEGEAWVAVEGIQESHVEPSEVSALVDEFHAIDYFTLDDDYEGSMTEMPTTQTSISIAGRSKAVRNDYGGLAELERLENRIDEVAKTSQWVDRSRAGVLARREL